MTPKRKLIRKAEEKYQDCNKTVLVTIPVINNSLKKGFLTKEAFEV